MFFLLGDDGGFCYETFEALVKALNAVLLSTLTSTPLSLFFLAETYQDRKTRSMDARDKKIQQKESRATADLQRMRITE